MKKIIIFFIFVILLVGCAKKPIACTAEAKLCPDGTSVGRDPNNDCEFFPCPGESTEDEFNIDLKHQSCVTGSDCDMIVTHCGKCDYPGKAVNKKYKEMYEKIYEQRCEDYDGMLCKMLERGYRLDCVDRKCKVAFEDVKQITDEESKEIARNFVENSATYKFDGFDLESRETMVMRCPYCWQFIFVFQSRAAGYGDRTGKMLAQVITPHITVVTVIEGEVKAALLDGNWDMVKQEMISE